MLYQKIGLSLAVLTLSGCATAPITLNYSPSRVNKKIGRQYTFGTLC